MTKLRDLERHLLDHGCRLLRQGAKHPVWLNPENGRRTTVPRHKEIPPRTARSICEHLGLPYLDKP